MNAKINIHKVELIIVFILYMMFVNINLRSYNLIVLVLHHW